jgi:hypothetical protein
LSDAKRTLSLNGSHVPGSSATASHPSASDVRTSVPKLPGSWIPSRAKTLLIGFVFGSKLAVSAPAPTIDGIASDATKSTPSADRSPDAFFTTCSGARITTLARTPLGSSSTSSRANITSASGSWSPPAPWKISVRRSPPATTTDRFSSRYARFFTSFAKCFTCALSVLVTRRSPSISGYARSRASSS